MPALTAEALETFLLKLEAVGLLSRNALAPGLTETEMDELTIPHGFRLPAELRVWWSGQNGGSTAHITSDTVFASLSDMLAMAEELNRQHDELSADGVVLWDRGLLPIVHRGESSLGCELDPAQPESPIWIVRHRDAEDLEGPILSSLGDLVDLWMSALDLGLFESHAETGAVVRHVDRPFPEGWPVGLP